MRQVTASSVCAFFPITASARLAVKRDIVSRAKLRSTRGTSARAGCVIEAKSTLHPERAERRPGPRESLVRPPRLAFRVFSDTWGAHNTGANRRERIDRQKSRNDAGLPRGRNSGACDGNRRVLVQRRREEDAGEGQVQRAYPGFW